MAKEYKVWIEIEEYDDETDKYKTIGLKFASTGCFDTEKEAREFAHRLHEIGENF